MNIKSYEVEKLKSLLIEKKIFLLYGENLGLKKEIKEIVKLSINKNGTKLEEVIFLESEIIKNDENFYNLIFSGSLFSNKKIILVYNVSDKIIPFIKKIESKCPQDIFLILFSEILEKKSKLRTFFESSDNMVCLPCYLDNEKSLELIIIKELKKEGINLSKESINLIIRKVNGDRINLKNELEKIKSFSENNKKIDHEQIKFLLNSSGEIKNDNLINTCLCGETFELKKILEDISIESLNQILLLKILSNKIRRLLSIKKQKKKNQTLDNMIFQIKPPIFWKDKPVIKKQLTLWKSEELANLINQINSLEVSCKKNPQISSAILFNFLTGLCKKASC